jgi:hypothetical protein
MLLLGTTILLLLSTLLGYYFGGKKGAIGSFLTVLFLFGLPVIIYVMFVE